MIDIPQPQKAASIFEWAIRLVRYLSSQRLVSGTGVLVKQTPHGITLSATPGSEAVVFSGVYYFKGVKYTMSGTAKAYWYHDATDNSSNWSDGPMPETMPDSQFWREAATCGSIVYILC